MTTQAQLIELAEAHRYDAGVRALLLSIAEARMQVGPSLRALRAAADATDYALKGEDGFRIGIDNVHIVAAAATMSAALTRMAADYSSLASVLEARGVDITY